jgi:hypothetical protein
LVKNLGFTTFFTCTAVLGLPVLLLIVLAMRYAPSAGKQTL